MHVPSYSYIYVAIFPCYPLAIVQDSCTTAPSLPAQTQIAVAEVAAYVSSLTRRISETIKTEKPQAAEEAVVLDGKAGSC